jgi:large repetitive protein
VTYDNVAPTLNVTSPADNIETQQTTVTVSGTAEVGSTVKINGTPVTVNATTGSFSTNYSLGAGTNVLNITATDAAGNVTTETRTVKTPVLTVGNPSQDLSTNQSTITVSGTAYGDADRKVIINGQEVQVFAESGYDEEGYYYSYNYFNQVVSLQLGTNTITVSGTDSAGYTTTITRTVTYDTVAPTLNVTSPADNIETQQTTVTVSGTAEVGSTVKINGTPVTVNATTGSFSTNYSLGAGTNVLNITATDAAGNVTTETRTVKTPVLTVGNPSQDLSTNQSTITVSGTAYGDADRKVIINGQEVQVISESGYDEEGYYSYNYFDHVVSLQLGVNTITVSGTDSAGYTTTITLNVTRT